MESFWAIIACGAYAYSLRLLLEVLCIRTCLGFTGWITMIVSPRHPLPGGKIPAPSWWDAIGDKKKPSFPVSITQKRIWCNRTPNDKHSKYSISPWATWKKGLIEPYLQMCWSAHHGPSFLFRVFKALSYIIIIRAQTETNTSNTFWPPTKSILIQKPWLMWFS